MTSRSITIALPTAVALVAAAVGCNSRSKTPGDRPPAAVDHVDRFAIPTSPHPLNWDAEPGSDGLAVQVFFERRSVGPLPVAVTGTIEFMLYEGALTAGQEAATPLHTWNFTGAELPGYAVRAAWGWGYAMRLGWGAKRPKTSSVTLLARYIPPTGSPVDAQPIIIPVGPR